jgi:hypothetical protein
MTKDENRTKRDALNQDSLPKNLKRSEDFTKEMATLKKQFLSFFRETISDLYITNLPTSEKPNQKTQYFLRVSLNSLEYVKKSRQSIQRILLDFEGNSIFLNGIEQPDKNLYLLETRLKKVGRDILENRAVVWKSQHDID